MRSMTYLLHHCRQTDRQTGRQTYRQTDRQMTDTGMILCTVTNIKTLPATPTWWRGR